MQHIKLCVFIALSCFSFAFSQQPKKITSSELYHQIQQLNFFGKVLYIAAHPDDENTRLISYAANHLKATTAYLSLTRGDGGQNLIGTELRELLGVLRTQELLAARRIDGGQQFFTRANDFGFSKHPDETLTLWDKESVLNDIVWVIRNFQPDVIINRFDHRTPGSTHGHHTSSALLSMEAFDLANQPDVYTAQLKNTTIWQPKRLFFNTSWWFYGSQENFEKADKSNMLEFNVGTYYPNLGVSNNEIAALASSQHLCQGFGRMETRGSEKEYIEFLKGDFTKNSTDLFEGIDTSWNRIEGGEAIGKIVMRIEANFNFKNPATHIPDLVQAYKALQKLPSSTWKTEKSKLLRTIIENAAGLYLDATTAIGTATPNEEVRISIEALNRSDVAIRLKEIYITNSVTKELNVILENNVKYTNTISVQISENQEYTTPYWLSKTGTTGMYSVTNPSYIGKPETPRAIQGTFVLDINGVEITCVKDIRHHYAKPDKGERYQPFEIVPEVSLHMAEEVVLFATNEPKQITVSIKSGANNVAGTVGLKPIPNWSITPKTFPFKIENKNETRKVSFTVTPPNGTDEVQLEPFAVVKDSTYTLDRIEIAYDHIPTQNVLLPASSKAVRLNINKTGNTIGYIQGAGDKIPESLMQIGYTVEPIEVVTITTKSLLKYDAIVLGIRAYNSVESLPFKQQDLLNYVKEGGNLIIQYNTTGRNGLNIPNLAPYPISVSRDRVTDENSVVRFINPEHPALNTPNKILQSDFEGWVQERGLYFPNRWSTEFTPILGMNDIGENELQGSLLIAPYGKGNYVYTGLSFFRELPAGVSGAYKLFANLLSLPKNQNNGK